MYVFIHLHPSYHGKINNGGENRPENITLLAAVLRGKLALQSYFAREGMGGRGGGWGGRWRRREKGRGIQLYSHFLK